ncbi:MAG: DMT family transporter [Candidatus Nucleicultricaceae bacterium]|jgi:drug/metabolite transporter (DMT)-like permease
MSKEGRFQEVIGSVTEENVLQQEKCSSAIDQNLSKNTRIATLIGLFAIVLWSFGASCAVIITRIPILEALSFTFFLAFLPSLARIIVERAWHQLKHPLRIWIFGVVSLGLQQLLYLEAFRYGHPAQVDIIIYCWPLIFMALSKFLLKERIGIQQICAIALGICSIILLKSNADGFFSSISALGYLYAALSAILWAVYCIYMRTVDADVDYAIGFYYGIGSIVMVIGHLCCETFVMPTKTETAVLCFIGLVMTGMGYSFWTYGLRRGHAMLLALLSYLNPFLSVFFLWQLGLTAMNQQILFASLLLGLAGWVGGLKSSFRKKKL